MALHADKHGSLLQDDVSFLVGLARHAQFTGIDLQYLCNIFEVRNEVRELTALAVSNTYLTIYNTADVLASLILFLSQYGIHT